MFSGGDSSGDGVNSRNQFNWQMTSQTSCNVNSGSIDWASLAQQWIQMKDSGAGLPEAPPPPIISSNTNSINKSIKQPTAKFDEQGEADMEVEKEDEVQVVGFGHNTTPPPPPTSARWIPISNQQQQDTETYCPPHQTWTWPARVALPPPILHVPITTGSLTPPIPKDIISSTTPPLQKANVNVELAAMSLPGKGVVENLPMDAAKRKILPAWIREGLEKMEREKLKQLERGTKDKDPSSAGTSAVDESDINNFKSMVKSSITEMEGESSGNEDANNETEPLDDTDADSVLALHANISTNDPSENILNSGKTYEERIAEMMIGVRKTLTELLLEVTNEEIVILANEAIRKRREKASSVQVIRKSAIPSITGKLGLEAYADSDSENSASDNDTTNDESKRSDDDYDSEEELKANIRICQRAFLRTIEEIEDKIEASEVRDELLLKEHRKDEIKKEAPLPGPTMSPVHQKTKRFDKDIGEPLQPDKKSNSNGKRRKERTSRFSDNKDSRNRNMSTSFYQPPALGSGSIPSQTMPGAIPVLPISNFTGGEFKSRTGNSSIASPSENDNKRSGSSSTHKSSKQTSASTSAHNRRHSDSSTSSSDSSSSSSTSTSHSRRSKYSDSRRKRSSRERSKRSSHKSSHRSSSHRSSSHRSSRRRDSSESNDDDRYSKRSSRRRQHKSHSSSKYSRRNDRRRSDSRSSRSRTRSRSRSRSTTYSSSRRGDRC
ncbi:arginine/serine-rich protein PNISR [Episyrphus balteatus]|uniref:arginine/serine-rich protein PNISR n=1 Tax=Episyrphus balteatus TaxID=286459 RepID=UPI002485BE56|nr:arginine/serine-rich protein PNISR [Episyrphus balteatus]